MNERTSTTERLAKLAELFAESNHFPYLDETPSGLIYNGDSMNLLKIIPDKAIDMVFADPPFNTGGKMGDRRMGYGEGSYDNLSDEDYARFCKEWITECLRIADKVLVTPGVGQIPLYTGQDWTMVISKPNGRAHTRWGGLCVWEPLLVYGKPYRMFVRDVVTYLPSSEKNGGQFHPCADNLNMVEWIIDTWSEKNQIVLDPFLGSGSTAISAKKLGRAYIGFEIQEKFCALSSERLRQSVLEL